MKTKVALQAALALVLFVPACCESTEMSASGARNKASRQVAAVIIDRTDVPWQASRIEDPDGIRSF